MMNIVLIVIVSLVLVACGSGGADNSSRGGVHGFVTNNVDGSILEDVTVNIDSKSTLTDSSRAYLIDDVNVGKNSIKASKDGYNLYSGEVDITENVVSSFSVVLNKGERARPVNGNDGNAGGKPGIYEYIYQFSVIDASSVTMSGTWTSDNGAIILLNGNRIVDVQGGVENNFSELNYFEVIDSTLFINGENTITLLIENGFGPTGVSFSASVSY